MTKCWDCLTHVNEPIIKRNDYHNSVWMLVKIRICTLNKLFSHIFKSSFSSAKANSPLHKGIINVFEPWNLLKEWALDKTKFGKPLPFALISLSYFPIHSMNSCSPATSLLTSLLRTSTTGPWLIFAALSFPSFYLCQDANQIWLSTLSHL